MAHGKTSANPNEFILPDLGEGVHEAELIKWRVKVGDRVNEHDILAEMETDKALVEVPSPRDGVIASLHGNEGEILKVGNPLITYASESDQTASNTLMNALRKGEADQTGAGEREGTARESDGEPPAEREDAGTVVGSLSALAGVQAEPGKVLATPAVRRLARDLGVDINAIAGTGIGGRVTEKDVRAARDAGAPSAPAAPRGHAGVAPMEPEQPHSRLTEVRPMRGAPAAGRPSPIAAGPAPKAPAPAARPATPAPDSADTQRIPFRGVRRTIANRLRESIDRAAHFNVMDDADASELDSLRRKLAAASGEKVSFLPFVASAICRALGQAEFRTMNATVDEPEGAEGEIVIHRSVHMGIATDTESGLMVPVIRDCDRMGVLEISRQIAAIAAAARNRSIPREQLVGSTFTISNVGSHAGRYATPIINYPEVSILGVGRARQAPVVRAGGLFVGMVLPLSLACDHRVVDGATAAMALAKIIELLQDPEQLMGPARA